MPQAQSCAARVDDDVADLSGGVGRAGEQLVVDHEARTDALGDAHEQDVSRLAGDEGELAEGSGVGVVGDAHRQAESGGQLRAEGDVVEAEVGGADDDAVGVDDAGRRNPDPEQRAVGLAPASSPAISMAVVARRWPTERHPRGVAAPHAVRATTLRARLTTAPRISPAPLRSRHTTWRASGTTETRVAGLPTDPDSVRPGFFDHPLSDELADDVGHGGGGEPAGPREIGATHRPGVEQGPEQQRAVLAPGVGGQRLASPLESGASPWRPRTSAVVSPRHDEHNNPRSLNKSS